MAAYKYPRIVEFRDDAADDRDRQDPQARAGLTGRLFVVDAPGSASAIEPARHSHPEERPWPASSSTSC